MREGCNKGGTSYFRCIFIGQCFTDSRTKVKLRINQSLFPVQLIANDENECCSSWSLVGRQLSFISPCSSYYQTLRNLVYTLKDITGQIGKCNLLWMAKCWPAKELVFPLIKQTSYLRYLSFKNSAWRLFGQIKILGQPFSLNSYRFYLFVLVMRSLF